MPTFSVSDVLNRPFIVVSLSRGVCETVDISFAWSLVLLNHRKYQLAVIGRRGRAVCSVYTRATTASDHTSYIRADITVPVYTDKST